MKDGSDDMPLNLKRKDALKKYLMAKGISANRIHINERQPNAINLIIIPDPSEKQVVENQNDHPENDNNNQTVDNNTQTNTISPAEGDVNISNMLFDFDKYETHAYDKQLDVLASYLVANPTAVIMIHGHTDSQGTDEYNDGLGLRRAKFVKDYLVSRGVNPKILGIKSHGEKELIAIDLNPETRKYNRRVEFQIIKQGQNKLTVLPMEIPDAYKIK